MNILIKKRENKLFLSFLFLILGVFILSGQKTFAYTITKLNLENQEDFVVEPGRTEIFLNPGETVTRNISVTNRTNRTLIFNVGVEDFIGSDNPEQTVVLLPAGSETPYPLAQYVRPELNEFSLEFGEKITFAVTISVPQDIEPGGHYGAVVISNDSPGQIDSAGNEVLGGTRLTSRIGSLILMRINGDVAESGYLASFKVAGQEKFFYQNIPSTFEVAFRNDGSVHLVPYGTITIKNMFGSEVAKLPLDAYFALPNSTRYQNVTWPGKNFSLGLYTADLELYKGYGNQFDYDSIKFFVLPLMVIVYALVGFLLIFGILYFISRKFEIKKK